MEPVPLSMTVPASDVKTGRWRRTARYPQSRFPGFDHSLAGATWSKSTAERRIGRAGSLSVQGRRTVKVLPLPNSLSTETSPPKSLHNSLTIESPRPVPEYSRVMASPLGKPVRPWRNFSKITCWSSSAMPTPVSLTSHHQVVLVVAGGGDRDPASLGRELDGVGKQVVEDLLHAGLVLAHRRQVGLDVGFQVDVLLLGQRPGHVALGGDDRARCGNRSAGPPSCRFRSWPGRGCR